MEENVIRCDAHLHTSFSTDSDTAAEHMMETAVLRGLKAACITDHLDLDFPFYEDLGEHAFEIDIETYFQKLNALRQKYEQKLQVRIGVELGLQSHLSDTYRKLTANYPFDFVIGSVHLVQGKDPYYREAFGEISDGELYRAAFETTLENVSAVDCFDVLGHLDYVVRYGREQAKGYSYMKYADILDEILRVIIEKGKGLELNTAGFKYGLEFCNPHPDILRRYRELGGEIVTVGSDAHQPEYIAWKFAKAAEILKDCGFRYYAEFESRRPQFHKIG